MARGRIVKAVILGFVWSMFISIFIVNWDKFKLLRWLDLTETETVYEIVENIKWNAGYLLTLSLVALVIALSYRKSFEDRNDYKKYDEDLEKLRSDRLKSPAYSDLPGNIHYNTETYPSEIISDK